MSEESQARLSSAGCSLNTIFYQLIQVALGARISLSQTPTDMEWKALYEMAKKQSLVGVCFAGVQRLAGDSDSINHKPYTINLPEALYLNWLGMAAKIQQRNEVMNRQCVELQAKLSADGLRSAILKGQGVGALYRVQNCGESSRAGSDPARDKTVENLSLLRQSGDIDVFVAGGMEKAFEYCKQQYGKFEWDYINAHIPVYEDPSTGSGQATEVEIHWRAQALTNLCANKRLQKWLEMPETQMMMLGGKAMLADGQELVVPTAEFNAFYILLHCYHHMFESGLGLRQLMDWYFVLKSRNNENDNENENLVALFEQFGMKKFAEGVLWLLWHVFEGENPDSFLVTPNSSFLTPNPKEGRFLLEEVMQNGNFGHHDERVKKVGSGKMSELWRNVQHNWHLASHYPSEFLWQPVWLAYHFFWKRMIKNKI